MKMNDPNIQIQNRAASLSMITGAIARNLKIVNYEHKFRESQKHL